MTFAAAVSMGCGGPEAPVDAGRLEGGDGRADAAGVHEDLGSPGDSGVPEDALVTAADAGSESSETAPRFLSFGANRSSLSQGESVRIVALVTDPQGIDDLIGGELLLGSINLGAFATGAQEGAYEISLSWQDMQDAQAIEFPYGETEERVLTARFYDQAGQNATRDLILTMTCNGEAACNGACIDTMSDHNNCGACGSVCGACSRGECPACLAPVTGNCFEVCGSRGLACDPSCSTTVWGSPDCSGRARKYTCGALINSYQYGSIRCCCG